MTVLAAYLGLLGCVGILGWTRCPRCGHLAITNAATNLGPCRHCRPHRHLTLPHLPRHTHP